MRAVSQTLLDALANSQGELILRVLTWENLAAYEAAPTTPDNTWLVESFDIFSTSAKVTLFTDNDYTRTNFTCFVIERGATIAGTEYTVKSGLYHVRKYDEFIGRIKLEGSSYPDLKISIAGDGTYQTVIEAFCAEIGKTAAYQYTSDAWLAYPFLPTGKLLNLNKAERMENLLKQKYTILCHERSPNELVFYTQDSYEKVSWSNICWSPERGEFLAVSNTKSMTSPNGSNWTVTTTPSFFARKVIWVSELNLYIKVGTNSGHKVATSPDGITWTNYTITTQSPECICWSPELGLLAIAGNNTTITTSSDGVTWTPNTSPDSGYTDICWSSSLGLYLAAQTSGVKVTTSSDGATWASNSLPAGTKVSSICWSPERGEFLIAGINLSTTPATYTFTLSTDGSTWTKYTSTAEEPATLINALCWSNDLNIYVIVGNIFGSITDTPKILTSTNGIDWTLTASPTNNALYDVCYSPDLGLLAAIGTSNAGNGVISSTNGADWGTHSTVGEKFISYDQCLEFNIVRGVFEVHFLWRDENQTLNTDGDTTLPQWNLGFMHSERQPPAVRSDPYYKFHMKIAPVQLDITDGDKINFSPYWNPDPTKLLNAMCIVSEHFDVNKSPAWWQNIESVSIFQSTEGGALPSTIERVAAYTPLASTGFDGNLSPAINNLQALAQAVDDMVLGGNIPLLTSDPSAPEDAEMWLLRTSTGAHADGEAMGTLGMTYTGDVGTSSPIQLSINDAGTTRRLTFS